MKKLLVLLLLVSLFAVLFVGCNETPTTTPTYTVMTPDGAPSMAIAKMMMDNNQFGRKANYSIIGSDAVDASLMNGDADFIIAPSNAGVMHSNELGTYKMVAVTSWGNLFVVGANTYKALSECANVTEFLGQFAEKEIASIGTNLVPVKTFKHILTTANINATLTASTAQLIQTNLKEGNIEFGILGEPAVTATLKNVSNAKRLCSVSEIWKQVVGTEFTQAGLFVKKSIIENDREAVDTFIKELKDSIEFLNASAANAKSLGNYMESTGKSTLKGAVVSKCYLQMSQKFVMASDVKDDILAFVKVLGVNVPADADIFYNAKQ